VNLEKLAVETNYVVTPANAVTAAGGLATWEGLNDYEKGQKREALILLIFGRTLDLVDGPIARATNTSSPRGEAFDAAIDKILMARALEVLSRDELLSEEEKVGLLIHNGLSAAGSVIAKARGAEIHPSKIGKNATALEWAGIGLAMLGSTKFSSEHPRLEQKIAKLRKATLLSGIVLGTLSAVNYLSQSINHDQTEE